MIDFLYKYFTSYGKLFYGLALFQQQSVILLMGNLCVMFNRGNRGSSMITVNVSAHRLFIVTYIAPYCFKAEVDMSDLSIVYIDSDITFG